jgi:hypothetical protein
MLGNMSYFPRLVRYENEESGRKINRQSQKNTRFTWFITKGYAQRVVVDFTMVEKNNTIEFYNPKTLIKLFNSQPSFKKTSIENLEKTSQCFHNFLITSVSRNRSLNIKLKFSCGYVRTPTRVS